MFVNTRAATIPRYLLLMLGTLPSDRRLLSNELDAEAGVSACMLGRTSSGEQTAQACANAFHEKAGRSQVGWWGFFVDMGFTSPIGLTDAILPSALLMSDSSLSRHVQTTGNSCSTSLNCSCLNLNRNIQVCRCGEHRHIRNELRR